MRSLIETFVITNISILLLNYNPYLVDSFSLKNNHNVVNNNNNYGEEYKLNSNDFDIQPIIKVKPNEFNANIHYYHHKNGPSNIENDSQLENNDDDDYYYYETPVLIEGALSPEKCDSICTSLVDCVGETLVDMQRKERLENDNKTMMDIYQVTFQEALDYMMESHHDDSFFCFCEGLIENNHHSNNNNKLQQEMRMNELQEFLTSFQEMFFPNDEDLLKYFPPESIPSNCVILAGEGASSTLHRDPFEWTGTSLCLEGTKLWRFIAPPKTNNNTMMMDSGVQVIDTHLKSYRLSSIAWNDAGADEEKNESPPITISSGWQSDYSFYYDRNEEEVPSALELASIKDEEERLAILEHIAHDPSSASRLLRPNFDVPTSIWTVIQKPGDLLIIPAHWWHQTYALEPSLAIASQRSGLKTRDAIRTLKHILICSNCATPNNVHQHPIIQNFIKEENHLNPQKLIDELFHTISKKHKGNKR